MLPSHYLNARQTFLDLSSEAKADVRRFYQEEGSDPHRLSTDAAYLGSADAETLVIIASGTHGVEGYAGSSCQFRFLHEHAARYKERGLGFLLVHAVNPWGYFHDRRVTREGVDLNRNFVDFPVSGSHGKHYDAYHDRLVKQYRPMPAGLWNELCLLSGAVSAARRREIQKAITTGQYHRADGLFFGGQSPVRSRVTWERIVDVYAQGRRRVFLLDIHTGLGTRGKGELISYLPAASADFRAMSEWLRGELKSMTSGESVSAAVEGTLTAAFDRRVQAQSCAVGLEFGTVAPLSVLNAMRADQWYHLNADRLESRHREWVRKKMKEAFAPSDVEWHSHIVERFDCVMDWIVDALSPK